MNRGLSAESPSASRSLLIAVFKTVVEIYERVLRPDLAAQLFTAHYLPGSFQQDSEHLKGLILNPDALALLAQFSSAKVHFENPETQRFGRAGFEGHRGLPNETFAV